MQPNFLISLLYLFLVFNLPACQVKNQPSDSSPISHKIWDDLLQKHVKGAYVNYKGFIQDSVQLNAYLKLLQEHHPSPKNWSPNERLAYWINAYNAFTVKLVVDHYPVESIKDIKKGIPFVNSVWDIKFIEIENATYDLNNIEHGIIRAKFKEPRIHFAVNCASISCPNLHNRAFVAEKLDEQLTTAAKAFLTDTSKNIISADEIQLSRIFQWYAGDFKKDGKSLIEYINQYATIKVNKGAKKSFLNYNWNLNDEES